MNTQTAETTTEITVAKPVHAVSSPTPKRAPRFSAEQIEAAQIGDATELPSIQQGVKAAPVPLSVEYWSPQAEGESKRCWILGIETQVVPDMETGELKEMEAVLLVEETPDGKKARFINAARVLVGNVRDAITRGEIIPATLLTPVQITYKGVKQNRSNARKSARWEILPLIVSVQG